VLPQVTGSNTLQGRAPWDAATLGDKELLPAAGAAPFIRQNIRIGVMQGRTKARGRAHDCSPAPLARALVALPHHVQGRFCASAPAALASDLQRKRRSVFPTPVTSSPLDSVRSPAIVLGREVATTTLSMRMRVAPVAFAIITVVAAHGRQGQWAPADNATAKLMVDVERQWAEAACTHNKITEKIPADGFQGTSPEGRRYTKPEQVRDTADLSRTARDCRLIDAKVRFFGDDLAMVYARARSERQKAHRGISNA